MSILLSLIGDAKTVGISGHVRPDGDCVGSCLAVWNYLKKNRPDIRADVYLEPFAKEFSFLKGAEEIRHEAADTVYDVYLHLDGSAIDRLGAFRGMFERAGRRVTIDHHLSNQGYGDINCNDPDSSSTCELLYTLMDEALVDRETAQCLYLGIVHDTGVFKHSNTTERAMTVAGRCLSKGVSSAYIIDETFYKKSFAQNKALGLALEQAQLRLEGQLILSYITTEQRQRLGLQPGELDGIIDQLRVTEGTRAALFLSELPNGHYKVSLRSQEPIDVSKICLKYGGGGHARAAGCELAMDWPQAMDAITRDIREQL